MIDLSHIFNQGINRRIEHIFKVKCVLQEMMAMFYFMMLLLFSLFVLQNWKSFKLKVTGTA